MGQRFLIVQTVAQHQNFPLPSLRHGFNVAAHLFPSDFLLQLLLHIPFIADHILQGQGIAVFIYLNGIAQVHLTAGLALGAEVHQDLVFNTPAGVSSQSGALGWVKTVYGFDEPNGADAYQILRIVGAGVVFFHNMAYQPQIALNERGSRRRVTVLQSLQYRPLLLGG